MEVVPDRVAKFRTENSSLIMLGECAGKYADAQYLLIDDVFGYGKKPQVMPWQNVPKLCSRALAVANERIAAFREFITNDDNGGYPEAEHSGAIRDDVFDSFMKEGQG